MHRIGAVAMAGRRNIEADFDVLIGMMASMIEAQLHVGRTDDDDWVPDLQTLSVKLFQQLCSARCLLEPISFPIGEKAVRFIDHASVIIVIRACIESYIAMHWIFGGGRCRAQKIQAQGLGLGWIVRPPWPARDDRRRAQ